MSNNTIKPASLEDLLGSSRPKTVPPQWQHHFQQLQDLLHPQVVEESEKEKGDLIDAANATAERANNASLQSNSDAILAEVHAAIARIYAGTYGICEKSGRPIEPDRLQAVPYARTAKGY